MRKKWGILAIVLLMLACASERKEVSRLSDHFRKYRDCESLHRLAGHLRLGTPRAEVERLLGKPDYSPIEGQFYYSSDRRTPAGTPVGLIVEYRTIDPRAAEATITGKLESLYLGPIGE
jgi:hypothetical protein